MLQGEHSAILLNFIKLLLVIKILILSIFEWPLFGYKGVFQSDFCEYLTEFYQISLKILVNLTDFSPQVMACTCMLTSLLTGL